MVKERVIAKKDHKKVCKNLRDNFLRDKYQGCLFIYDDEYKKYLGAEQYTMEDLLLLKKCWANYEN